MIKRLFPLLILSIAIGVSFYLLKTKPKAKPVTVEEKAWLVAVESVEKRTLAPSFTLYGRIESLWHSNLTAGVSADILEIKVVDGSQVRKGDVLVILDDRDTRLLLAQREAELEEIEAKVRSEQSRHQANLKALPSEKRLLELTRAEVTRLQGLVNKKVSAQSQLDTARQSLERQAIALSAREQLVIEHKAKLAELNANMARAKALRDQAQIELSRTSLVAPFNGVVTEVKVSPGKNVRVGESLIQLYDEDALVIKGQVPTRYLGMINQALDSGQPVSLSGELDQHELKASLLNLSGQTDSGSGGVEGIFRIETHLSHVQHGRFVHLNLILPQQQNLIAVPHESVYGTDKVYVTDNENRLRARQVRRIGEIKIGKSSRTLIHSDALEQGDKLVVTQLPNAVDGLLIRVAAD